MLGEVQQTTERFEWSAALKWGLGMAGGMVLTIAVGVWALVPGAEGVSTLKMREAMSRIALCTIEKEQHVCVAVEPKK